MKWSALTALAGGSAATSLITTLIGHGTIGFCVVGAVVGFGMLLDAVAPEVFWLVALVMARRLQRWQVDQLDPAQKKSRQRAIARDPFAEIVRARARTNKKNPKRGG
jgi:uncharacterized membrane protein YhiD involved in acid resistance